MTPDPKNLVKRMKMVNRENQLASDGRKMTTQTIKSKRDKANCPKKQRKSRNWLQDL